MPEPAKDGKEPAARSRRSSPATGRYVYRSLPGQPADFRFLRGLVANFGFPEAACYSVHDAKGGAGTRRTRGSFTLSGL